ncbi:MAG: restriction endonuclease, partial [Mariprofundaceae bacterium]|nr:restriction endonuclease [Mariprofundaceae bacterium]
MNYDFSQLNDKEFEVLVNDLLSAFLDTRIERFRPGRDGGIDGRFFSDEGKQVIVQTKHYLNSGLSKLISTLKNEKAKVSKLNPSRYLVVTSLSLSPKNKQDIMSIFSPYITSEADIFGQEDLNDILAKNKQIEEKHFKLWISSTTVLQRLFNNAIKGRSQFEIENIKKKSAKYVQTSNHQKALDILEKKHDIIISGEPGIGKTTLAENLCLFYVSKGY